jgi:polyisoprenoid-binding protein YceI
MRHSFKVALGILTLLTVAGSASAARIEMIIDRSHTEVGFSVRHFFNKVHGEFTDFSGAIQYDPDNLTNSTVEVTIRDTSIFTGNDRRDSHMRTEDFFWTEKYPLITFKSTKVTAGKEKNHFQIAGDLTIRDVTKPVVLETEFLGMGQVAVSGRPASTQAGFLAKTTVNRKDFGILWNRNIDQGGVMLGDDVDIELEIAAMSKPPAPTAAKTGAEKPAGDKK